MTASMTESCTMTRETGTITRSPTFASRAATRDRIFSATVLGNDPLPKQRVELVHREWARVGEGLDAPCDLAQLVFSELQTKLLGAMVDRVLPGETVGDVDRSLESEVRGIEDRVAVGDRAPGVVVAVEFDVAAHVVAELDGERVALTGARDADGVGDADAVHAHPVHGRVHLEEIALGRPEAVLAREADLLAVIADEGDDLAGVLDDLVDAFAVAELAEDRGRAEEDVDAIDAGLHGDARVIHVAAHVREHFRPERKRGDRPAILERLGRRHGRGELDVFDPEGVEQLGDGYLVCRCEVRVRELLPLAERRVDDRESLDRHRSSSRHTRGGPPSLS